MKRLLAVAFAFLVACHTPTELPRPLEVAGYYRLVSINGLAMPATIEGFTTSGGGMRIFAADSAWLIGDTTSAPFPGLFRWGGRMVPNGSSYAFKDSTLATIRYTGMIEGDIFTLVSSRTYRYQKQP